MKKYGAWALPLILAACGAGEDGAAGRAGAHAGACSVTEVEAGWQIRCPDGSSATLEPGACAITERDDGAQIIRCADGTEAVVQPAEQLGPGAVRGVVALEGGGDVREVLVEIVGTGRAASPAADGSFTIDGIPAGTYDVEATLSPWLPVRVTNVTVLPGKYELGTLQLRIGRTIGGLGEGVNIEFEQQLLFDGYSSLVVDMRTDETWTVGVNVYDVDDYGWSGDGVLVFEQWDSSLSSLAFWRRGTGLTWFHGLDSYLLSGGAAIAVRTDESEESSVVLLRASGEEVLPFTSYDAWGAAGDNAVWILGTPDGTVLVDARTEVTRVVTLDPRTTDGVRSEPTPSLAWLAFGATYDLFDLSTGEVVVTGLADASVGLVDDEIALWSADGNTHFYDATTGNTWSFDVDFDAHWSPERKWLMWWDADGFQMQARTGSAPVEVGTFSVDAFAPFEAWSSRVLEDGSVEIWDLAALESRTVEGPFSSCEWIDEPWLLCQTTSDEITLVSGTGDVHPLGAVDIAHVAGGRVFVGTATGLQMVTPGSSVAPMELPRAQWADVSPDRMHLLWYADGKLFVMSFVSGARFDLGRTGEFLALADVVLYTPPTPWGDYALQYAPYP